MPPNGTAQGGGGDGVVKSKGAALISRAIEAQKEGRLRDRVLKANQPPELSPLSLLVDAISGAVKPQGEPGCDHTPLDRVVNVVTSIPYVAVGVHNMRNRETKAGQLYGACMLAVGVAAAAYHATSDKTWRPWMRRLDYWTICITATSLTRAVYQRAPPALSWASYCLVPFEPFKLSVGNTIGMEIAFLWRAIRRPHLRRPFAVHAASSAAGITVFAVEEMFPKTPFVHAVWHCLAAVGAASTGALLADVERDLRQRRDAGSKSLDLLFPPQQRTTDALQ